PLYVVGQKVRRKDSAACEEGSGHEMTIQCLVPPGVYRGPGGQDCAGCRYVAQWESPEGGMTMGNFAEEDLEAVTEVR
ncbi:MAG: hypothetical protein JWO89_3673, partial [Verrucomicrobiaceae bacterium]|nr:hypothetical protein [Verrucomicrobiaceae bacterium]